MPNFAAKYSSEYLSAERMREAIEALPSILQGLRCQTSLTAHYGHGSNLHTALLYIPMSLPYGMLPFFLKDSMEQRIVVPGESDLLVALPNDTLSLVYCHESDIHVNGNDDGLVERFVCCDQYRDIKFYSRSELEEKYPGQTR